MLSKASIMVNLMSINYSFELYEFDEALTPYGYIETKTPPIENVIINDFREGNHFRTGPEENTNSLQLQLEDRLITIVLDESGSMSWNDQKGDRFDYLKRLLQKLDFTYPGKIRANLIGFGGVPITTNIFLTQGGADFAINQTLSFDELLKQTFEDSIFDFSGVRVVRRNDRFPEHPADGVIISEGVIEATKDDNLIENSEYYYGLWTFNKDEHFGKGQFIKSTPRDRIIPTGVNFITAEPRLLPGVRRDEFTQIIYNFQEGSGRVIYDSSGFGRHGILSSQAITENFWSGDAASLTFNTDNVIKKPVGVKFDGLFDIVETDNSKNTSIVGSNLDDYHGLTINFWLFRYQQSDQAWIVGTSSIEPSNQVGWAIGIMPNGKIGVKIDDDISSGFDEIPNSDVIVEKQWTMVTVIIDASGCCSLYINGVLKNSSFCFPNSSPNIDTSYSEKIYLGAKPVDSGASWSGIDYFGSIAQVSISNTTRNENWINETYDQEFQIFQQDINSSNQIPPDNLQREVIVSWQIGSDFDFENGNIKIIRKYKGIPSHDNDGDIVTTQNASVGDFFFLDSFDFTHNSDYYYRIFTYNSLGNSCERSDARVFPVHIQPSTANSKPLNISNETILPGNKKLLLQWSASTDTSVRGTRIYFGNEKFPTLDLSAQGNLIVSDGVEIADLTDVNYFVHRTFGKNCDGADIGLINGKNNYYTIVTYDKYNNMSDPVFLAGIPESDSVVAFPPQEITNLHVTVVNKKTLSLMWQNPTIKSNKLDLYLGDTALVYVNIKDIYGGNIEDLNNIELKFCTTIKERNLKTSETELSNNNGLNDFEEDFNQMMPCSNSPLGGHLSNEGSQFSVPFDDRCNGEREISETNILFSVVESGLLKGVITHTNDRAILSRRNGYIINARAQYKIIDSEKNESIFEFHTEPVTVTFSHPIKITTLNKRNKFFTAACELDNEPRLLNDICSCNQALDKNPCPDITYNGGYVGATQPYICRVELQYKGESLPDGTPINVQLFKHDTDNSLSQKSDRTFIREGRYLTSAIMQNEVDDAGELTGNVISKSICDIEMTHPSLPDWVDLYVSLDFAGFLVDAVHEVRFISNVFIKTDITKPFPDGIDSAEQFATVWQVNPDDPFNPDANIPVPDGTLVKWELVKLRFAKDRPFYSTEQLPVLISGVYSTTISGVARKVFFGPVGNLESHTEQLTCKDEEGSLVSSETCCIAEEYEIIASVILKESSAQDAVQFAYDCNEDQAISNKRFLMNAAEGQTGSNPHWITWADGVHLLKFQIAKNAAISTILGASCFRECVESQSGGQLFELPEEQIIQITAPGEILWDVTFSEDPYTGELSPVSFQSAQPTDGQATTANIPLRGETTDFYLRFNKFVNDANPKPQECADSSGGDGLGSGSEASPCEWESVCEGISICVPSNGRMWDNVNIVSGTTTLIADNKEITLFGGGDYKDGIPPIYVGFKEPLDVRVIEARINGQRTSELVVDSFSIHTFVVEVTFAGEAVPDGTKLTLSTSGPDQDVIILSDNVIYAQNINDPLINPSGNKRSLAFFSINPIPNISFTANINIDCTYDKLGTADRLITRCVSISNTVNSKPPTNPLPGINDQTVIDSAVSNEEIIYDTIDDSYSTTTSSSVGRIGHFVSASPLDTLDLIYHFGGFTNSNNGNSGITAASEVFNNNTKTWEFTTDMPTPRCFGMTIRKNEKVYCIGGVELDQLLSQYTVSRKIESFDVVTETWNTTLSPMPENYGVAYGDAQIVGDYIYVTCGIKSIVDSSKPGDLNEKILRYSIRNDSWDIISPSNSLIYQRVAPFGFYRDSLKHTPEITTNVATNSNDIGYEISGVSWNPGTPALFGNNGSNNNIAIRWPISLPDDAEITNAVIKITFDASIGSGDISGTINLLDINNAADQVWSSGAGPTETAYSVSKNFFGSVGENNLNITNIVQNYIKRTGFFNGGYIGIKLDWTGLNYLLFSVSSVELELSYEINPKRYYIYGGSIPKSPDQIEIERNAIINKLLDQFRSFILTSSYYLNLSTEEQQDFVQKKESEIMNSVQVAAYIYPSTGFKFKPGSEFNDGNSLVINIDDPLDDEWSVSPKARDLGKCIYIASQDVAYFIGGSNQNLSTTLNTVEAIDLTNNNLYDIRRSLARGRSMFGATVLGDDIYISGGLTSGHQEGWVQIGVQQFPEFVEALGTQSCGMIITLKNDSGEVIQDDIRIDVRGKIRMPIIDDILIEYAANRAADRALGGDGSGNAPDKPQPGETTDPSKTADTQNSILDPNSDQFQFNAAKKLNEQVFLFPVLYKKKDFITENGIGGTSLLPRSEDPLDDFQKLSEFIKQLIANTPVDNTTTFEGDLTRDELAALGDVLNTVTLPVLKLDSNSVRELYNIETIVTILDDFYFGQTVSDFDLDIQQRTDDLINQLLNPPAENTDTTNQNGTSGADKNCFVLQHLAQPDIPGSDTPDGSSNPNNPSGTGGFTQSGQCLFCESLLPLNSNIRNQNPTILTTYFNTVDWIPQIKRRIVDGGLLSDVIEELDTIDHEPPFGSSQLYDAITASAIASGGDIFDEVKKVIYVLSDNSQNLSTVTRTHSIEEVNAIDGDNLVPIIYTVFSTSFPLSLSALLERSDVGDVEKLTEETGGQSTTLISSDFIDQILNLALGSATGGLGYGIYTRKLKFDELSAIMSMTSDFDLPSNTNGYIRFRYSKDGYNFGDFSEKFSGSDTFDFKDFFAKTIEFEVVLTTGFTSDITEEYDASPTGIPKLRSIALETSGERDDFVYLNKETVLTNAQQVAAAFEGTIPESSIVEFGVSTSDSHDWSDFQSLARPPITESGKTFILERSRSSDSVVPNEPLFTYDNILFTSIYGPWDPASTVSIFYIEGSNEIPVLSGFKTFPRDGQIYFDTKQPPTRKFIIEITNSDTMRVGVRLRNRLNTDSIKIEGVGYIYSTNDNKPPALSQVAPSVFNVTISPESPTSIDTFIALYEYRDLNNNPEKDSILSWFKNGLQLLEIQNKISWSNSDLLLSHKLEPGDRIQFSITPSDGIDFGSTIFSSPVTIQPREPSAENVRITPIRNGVINDRYDTSSTLTLDYDFSLDDQGVNAVESGTVIRWLVNGVVFKEGTFTSGAEDPYFDPKSIEPTEIINGTSAHIIGNQVQVEVTPKTPSITGTTVRSASVTIENSRPIISNVLIQPLLPNSNSTLSVTYSIDDRDISISKQTDQSEIKWFKTINGEFVEVTELKNEKTVPSFYLSAGEQWKAEVDGFDGLDLSDGVFSNIVTINL